MIHHALFRPLRSVRGAVLSTLSFTAVFAALATAAVALPVFPGAVGFGTDTPAGRGGQVYRVTNLNNDGPGSLRHGVESVTGPRVIIFDVSGVIRLKSNIVVRDKTHGQYGNLTIAGQTAPAPGITLAGAALNVMSNDVLVQHIAIRPGDRLKPTDNRDAAMVGAAKGQYTHHVVFDHVTMTWAVDETFSTWSDQGEVSDVTLLNSIAAKPVVNGGHSKGSHPYGVLGGRNTHRFSIIGNIMAFNFGRNPLIRDRTSGAQIVNNLVYHPGVWSNAAAYIGNIPLPPKAVSIVGNVFIRRPLPYSVERTNDKGVREVLAYQASDYRNTAIFVHESVEPGLNLYLHDNRIFDPQSGVWHPRSGDPYDPQIFLDSKKHPVNRVDADLWAGSGGTDWKPFASAEVEKRLLAGAGKMPANRDTLDAELINEIRTRTGDYLEDLSDLGEDPWAPADVQNRRVLELPKNPNGDDDGDGYTNLEEWLHRLAAEVEGRSV